VESCPTVVEPGRLPPCIRLLGARAHNLRNLTVEIPQNQLVVITGPSGSGKSSLAFDTLFAEGQRQYIETLSTYARQFLPQLERPDVDEIRGLPPTICIDQRQGGRNPRSTVATVTEIYDYLRLLMARFGNAKCFQCGTPIQQQSPEQIQDRVLRLADGTKTILLAPLVVGRKGEHREVLAGIRKTGLVRARIDGQIHDIENTPVLDARKPHTIEAVVDRIVVRTGIDSRAAESVRMALQVGEGVLGICYQNQDGEWIDETHSTRYACPNCDVSVAEIEPRSFSFNSPFGACEQCSGLGIAAQFDPEILIPDRSRSLDQGAVLWFGDTLAKRKRLRKLLSVSPDDGSWSRALDTWNSELWTQFWDGDASHAGLAQLAEKEWATATDPEKLAELEYFRTSQPCAACHGGRLRPESLSVTIAGKNIHEICAQPIKEAVEFFSSQDWQGPHRGAAQLLCDEITRRLNFLNRVGLSYLSLARSADTLSGGELQRVRLATCIGSGLVGVCYILDEPSIGLHSGDTDSLLSCLTELRDLGNSVVVVEHDEAIIRQADHIIDMGPGAGERGGDVVAIGTLEEISANANSPTGKYLGAKPVVKSTTREVSLEQGLRLTKCSLHNLRDVDLECPLGVLTCVTGVSGSGKSSLISGTLVPAIRRYLGAPTARPGPYETIRGLDRIERLIPVDQAPIGRTSRSNPATYSGVFDDIRKIFAATREAKQRGFSSARFSFNNAQGRCSECNGQGLQRIEMNFLPDQFVRCSTCNGARFNRQTLSVRFAGKSIADVLDMAVDEAADFFENIESIRRVLTGIADVGLGYLRLGQPSNTLSGGEAQRLKLATHLVRATSANSLLVMDEPTTGLHFQDVERLIGVLNKLVDAGNTVLVIEHHLDVIRAADWVIDMGPGGGQHGGQIIAAGAPARIAKTAASVTGKWL
jgi:excinuclease ABC subunit A